MKNIKYTRDPHSKALLMADETIIAEFLQKKSINAKLEELESSINILKSEIVELQANVLKMRKKGR